MKVIKNLRNNRPGFTFAEILLALTVLAVSMYIFTGLQFRAMNKTRKSVGEVERVYYVKKELYKLFLQTKPNKKAKKSQRITLTKPSLIIETKKKKIDAKKSALKNFAKEIDIIIATGEWKEGRDKQSMTMISFVAKPRPKQEKKPGGADEKK